MTKRSFALLILVAAAAVVLALLAQREPEAPTVAADGLLFPELKAGLNDAVTVEIIRPGGEHLSLSRKDGPWVLETRGGYDADAAAVRKLLVDLTAVTALEAKTADPAKHHYLGVQDLDQPGAEGTLLRVENLKGEPLLTAIIGKAGEGGYYVRRATERQAWLARGVPELHREPKRWLARDLFPLAAKDIQRVSVTPPGGQAFVLARAKPEDAHFALVRPADQALKAQERADALATALPELRLDDVKPMEQARLDRPLRVLVQTFDGLQIQGEIARDGDDGISRWSVSFDEALAERLLEARGVADQDRDQALAAARQKAEQWNARVTPWAFVLPGYQVKRFELQLQDLIQPSPGA